MAAMVGTCFGEGFVSTDRGIGEGGGEGKEGGM